MKTGFDLLRNSALAMLFALGTVGLSACGDEGDDIPAPSEPAGMEDSSGADDMMQDAEEGAEDAANAVDEAVEDAGDAMDEAVEDAGDAMDEGMEDTKDQMDKMSNP